VALVAALVRVQTGVPGPATPHRRAALLQATLAMFMIYYTFFALWWLASRRGL